MDLLTECCDKFREMVYNYCSLFIQQMLPQVDGLTYPIQHRFTQSMNFIIQCISKFFTVAKLQNSCQILVTDCLRKMELCGHSFHVSKIRCNIFAEVLHFCINYHCNMTCYYKISDIGLKLQDGGGGGRVEAEGDLKQSVNYQLKDFFSFC